MQVLQKIFLNLEMFVQETCGSVILQGSDNGLLRLAATDWLATKDAATLSIMHGDHSILLQLLERGPQCGAAHPQISAEPPFGQKMFSINPTLDAVAKGGKGGADEGLANHGEGHW